ncbi:hypothetical protein [Streptomyces buecherae]|uniref:Uncharacterized protein n=1 Tax=Streptomyces buecherae TaxID=2763006 RepID=A0A7H8NBW1_9ACTN|nr:hypothetical protein [Streptomyces buecherae]QKW51914.1 hypothetical protein HUT08_22930 [Streptomyces buecherae]
MTTPNDAAGRRASEAPRGRDDARFLVRSRATVRARGEVAARPGGRAG